MELVHSANTPRKAGSPRKVEPEMRSRYKACARAVLVLCLAASSGRAQDTREAYQRAQQFLPGNLRHRMFIADVTPHWIAEKNRFWYRKAGMKDRKSTRLNSSHRCIS